MFKSPLIESTVEMLKNTWQMVQEISAGDLFLLAAADSSFLSLPAINDLLVAVKSSGVGWSSMFTYVLMALLGSALGCTVLYGVARFGGDMIRRRRKGFAAKRLHGMRGFLTIMLSSMSPPPMPFKAFVLSAGIARFPYFQFLSAILLGRGIRYGLWGVLSVIYGQAVQAFIKDHLQAVGIGCSLVLGAALLWLVTRYIMRIPAKRRHSVEKVETGEG